jgi:hypothetical protein
MAENKTKQTTASVTAFLNTVADAGTRRDCKTLVALMRELTGEPPKMWGPSMVGFGSVHYKYASGREGDMFLTGFSPRQRNLTLYIMEGFFKYGGLMKRLGSYKTGKSCLYVRSLDDIDPSVLRELISTSVADLRERVRLKGQAG